MRSFNIEIDTSVKFVNVYTLSDNTLYILVSNERATLVSYDNPAERLVSADLARLVSDERLVAILVSAD